MVQNYTTIQPTDIQNQATKILNGVTGQLFNAAVDQALAQGARMILVDCQALTFVDSSGLGAMVVALKAARAANCKFCLCSINDQIETLFELTDTRHVFDIYPDRAAFEAAI